MATREAEQKITRAVLRAAAFRYAPGADALAVGEYGREVARALGEDDGETAYRRGYLDGYWAACSTLSEEVRLPPALLGRLVAFWNGALREWQLDAGKDRGHREPPEFEG
jgi:hypothetical protein